MFPNKSYSWLQWPVALKGLSPEHHAHLTVKFFGATPLAPQAMADRVGWDTHVNWSAQDFAWVPKIWMSGESEATHYVLAFIKYPTSIDFIHGLFKIVRDQYIPWTPHITVPKEYFLLVEDQGFSPKECDLTFGELELCLGGPNV